eukprot:1806864-Pyramimonas_sp.AAC.1
MLGNRTWNYLSSEATLAKYEYIGMVESHTGAHTRAKWARRARAAKLKFLDNPARSTGRGTSKATEGRAYEGGEIMLARGHLSVHRVFDKP